MLCSGKEPGHLRIHDGNNLGGYCYKGGVPNPVDNTAFDQVLFDFPSFAMWNSLALAKLDGKIYVYDAGVRAQATHRVLGLGLVSGLGLGLGLG